MSVLLSRGGDGLVEFEGARLFAVDIAEARQMVPPSAKCDVNWSMMRCVDSDWIGSGSGVELMSCQLSFAASEDCLAPDQASLCDSHLDQISRREHQKTSLRIRASC